MQTFADEFVTLHHGDCLDVMHGMEAESVDAIVTDPPYGLGFMGREWDHGVPGEHFWREALRVAKPGAHLVAFGGTRTYHRLAVAIEDAGWEIRDGLGWLYGSGFPKSLDVSKAIDKAAGAQREVLATRSGGASNKAGATVFSDDAYSWNTEVQVTAPVTESAARWQGWGTALKPAWEPIILARKPLAGTVAANVQAHGTGALNIDGCRIATDEDVTTHAKSGYDGPAFHHQNAQVTRKQPGQDLGRWPANIVHDGSDEVLAVFPETSSGKMLPTSVDAGARGVYAANAAFTTMETYGDTGSAARFFYCAKATTSERNDGLWEFEAKAPGEGSRNRTGDPLVDRIYGLNLRKNFHPTVKPIALMRWLVRLVTPPGGVVLDPFMGSGTTLIAARAESFRSIGIDLEAAHCEIARGRMSQGVLL